MRTKHHKLVAAGIYSAILAGSITSTLPVAHALDTITPPPVTSRTVAALGPSQWTGKPMRHPSGGKFYPGVIRWANLVSQVMVEHHVPKRYLPGILAQIQQESGGNPTAVNNWDINAKNGTPSKGLLQVIAPTYRAYAKPGYKSLRYQTVPYTNIWASLNYVKHNYGMVKFKYWNQGHNQGY